MAAHNGVDKLVAAIEARSPAARRAAKGGKKADAPSPSPVSKSKKRFDLSKKRPKNKVIRHP